MQRTTTKNLIIQALGIAVVFTATFFIKIPNGIQGYFNLGDGFIFIFATIVNPVAAFLIGGFGSAFADVAGGYGIYFFFTLCIKGLEAMIVSLLISHKYNTYRRIVAYGFGSLIMISGYFIADAIINASWQLALTGLPANLLQALCGMIIATLCATHIKKSIKYVN